MTREEQTISNLKKLKSFHNGSYGADIDRAIRALEQQFKDDISRQYGLTDADTDKYAVQVQNGEGYYNSQGKYVSYDLD